VRVQIDPEINVRVGPHRKFNKVELALQKLFSELSAVNYEHGHATINNVYIDLRHELLQEQEWTSPSLGDFDLHRKEDPDLPLIWFPWFDARIEKSRLPRVRLQGNVGSLAPPRWRSKSEQRKFQVNIPEFIVEEGDRIYIDRVEIENIGDEFDHPHDSEIRRAFLRIVRTNSAVKYIKRPIIYRRDDSIVAPNTLVCGFRRIRPPIPIRSRPPVPI